MFGIILVVLGLAMATSVDAVGLGISFGVRRIKIGFKAMLVMSFTGIGVIVPSILVGMLLKSAVGSELDKIVSGAILIGMGLWIVLQSRREKKPTESRTVKIIREPEEGDIDGSGSIDCIEAVFIGVAMSVDSVGIGMGAGGMVGCAVIFPFVAMLAQLISILIGVRLGERVGEHFNTTTCTFLSGVVVMLIGIVNITW